MNDHTGEEEDFIERYFDLCKRIIERHEEEGTMYKVEEAVAEIRAQREAAEGSASDSM